VETSGTLYSNGAALTSDKRLKTNIVPISNAIETIMKLNPVHYDKKNTINSKEYAKSENGFIAQEIQKILPFIVKEGTDADKLLSVDYNSIIPVLAKAIQEQQKEIEELKELVKQLINKK
jgi:CRISPR/Cas system CSM-associated protein Csm2 small subunit